MTFTTSPIDYGNLPPCFIDFLNIHSVELNQYMVVETPDQKLAILLQADNPRTYNSFAYTASQLPLLKEFMIEDSYLHPEPLCEVNPAELLLYGATTVLAGPLSSNTQSLMAELAQLQLRPGDVLIWRDDGRLFHSATLYGQTVNGEWLVDEKWMYEKKPNLSPLDITALAINQMIERANVLRSDPELEFEAQLALYGMPTSVYIDVRRPIPVE